MQHSVESGSRDSISKLNLKQICSCFLPGKSCYWKGTGSSLRPFGLGQFNFSYNQTKQASDPTPDTDGRTSEETFKNFNVKQTK